MCFHATNVGHPRPKAGSRNAQRCARSEQPSARGGTGGCGPCKIVLMNAAPPVSPHADDQRARTLERLRALGGSVETFSAPPGPGAEPCGHLLRYSCRERQRLSSIVFESPWIVVVLEGRKRLEGAEP